MILVVASRPITSSMTFLDSVSASVADECSIFLIGFRVGIEFFAFLASTTVRIFFLFRFALSAYHRRRRNTTGVVRNGGDDVWIDVASSCSTSSGNRKSDRETIDSDIVTRRIGGARIISAHAATYNVRHCTS